MSTVVIIAVVVVLVLVVGAIWLYRMFPRGFFHTDQAAYLKQLTQALNFYQPGDATLDPQIEYLNIVTPVNAVRSDLTVFAVGEIVETRLGLTRNEVRQFIQAGGWGHIADRYQPGERGMCVTSQYQRPRA